MAAALWLLPAAAHGQVQYNYLVGISAGIGGTSDADPDPGFDGTNFQALFGLRLDNQSYFTARLGRLQLAASDDSGGRFDADLSYLILGGEYRFAEAFYESGLFFGLGAYDLEGDDLVADESGVGLAVGVTGDFEINDRWSVIAELAGHLVDLDYSNFFVTGNVGVGFRF
ncbi:MAG: hypothetical protein D6696_20005 [Acidobacteria bacterium]|nr:MAG: hypothetical protein D6696_20005 [Acidobacteriota bacterium]